MSNINRFYYSVFIKNLPSTGIIVFLKNSTLLNTTASSSGFFCNNSEKPFQTNVYKYIFIFIHIKLLYVR